MVLRFKANPGNGIAATPQIGGVNQLQGGVEIAGLVGAWNPLRQAVVVQAKPGVGRCELLQQLHAAIVGAVIYHDRFPVAIGLALQTLHLPMHVTQAIAHRGDHGEAWLHRRPGASLPAYPPKGCCPGRPAATSSTSSSICGRQTLARSKRSTTVRRASTPRWRWPA